MSVSQLESKWRRQYQLGYNALDAHDYTKAEAQFKACIELLTANDAANSTSHINTLIKLGETYYAGGNTRGQKEVESQILNIRQTIRPGSKRFIEYLYGLGLYYSNTGRYADAIKYLDEALTFYDTLSKMPGTRSRILHRQALCYYCSGNTGKAIGVEINAVEADENRTPDYKKALAYYYFQASDWANLEMIMPGCYDDAREPILRKFSQSKASDRAAYWSKTGLFFTDYLPSYAYAHASDILVSYAYDAALFSKGVLLAAENKTSEITLNSSDPEMIKLYAHYLELKGKKNRTTEEEFEMQSLSDVILRYQKEHKNEFRRDFRIRWTDVQEKLGDSDIAIEFITIPDDSGYDNYAALSIKKGMKSPKLTKLASFKQLSSISPSSFYTSPELYNLVWGALEDDLEGIQNVYFSPAGMFYSTGIEYLPNELDMAFNATRNVYRLSSTKELVLSQTKKPQKAVLFGGINYDTNAAAMEKQSSGLSSDANPERAVPVESTGLRAASESGGFAYLDGTMEEVGDISMIFLETDIASEVYSGDDGSEPSFKRLTGGDVDLMHIATHGFYYANNSAGRSISLDNLFKNLNLHFTSDDIQTINEDKMLTRSGLILAGANNVIRHVHLPEGVDDGVLYADEIAAMNLSSVDLLVISACQSGLGDLASSEGVFGLQRGFKLAGVHSIVMSLWKVDDEATRILMTMMYTNMAAGMSKRESLTNAQFALRLADGGRFDNPQFWAAFVLLDALD